MTNSVHTRNKRAGQAALLCLFAAVGCGGNYSNQDLDFQNAVPVPGELSPSLSALVTANSSELYLFTHKGVHDFGNLFDGILGAIDTIRRYPATGRTATSRIWGPWHGEGKDANLDFRVTINKVAPSTAGNIYGYDLQYAVDVSPRAANTWSNFITGTFSPRGGVRHGIGSVTISTTQLRAAGIPLGDNDFGGVETLAIQYETLDTVHWSAHILMHADALQPQVVPGEGDFTYTENAGTDEAVYNFYFRGGTDLYLTAARITSRWRLSDSAGRADLTVTEGLASGMTATDCWGSDTVATYVHRDWDASKEAGVAVACIFPATP